MDIVRLAQNASAGARGGLEEERVEGFALECARIGRFALERRHRCLKRAVARPQGDTAHLGSELCLQSETAEQRYARGGNELAAHLAAGERALLHHDHLAPRAREE